MTAGSSVILNSTIPEASATYPNAITGTITLLTLAIRWIPPKIMASVSTVSTAPTILGSKPNEPCMAAQIVLLCTELNAKPKVTEIKMANSMPIQFSPNPPTILGSKPNEPCMAAQIVLLCTELNAKPKVTEIKMANSMPIQFSPNPYRI